MTMQIRTVRVALAGLGNVNLGWMKIVLSKKEELASAFHIEFLVVAVADSSGVAINNDGWDMVTLISLKQKKGFASQLNGYLPKVQTETIPNYIDAHLLIES